MSCDQQAYWVMLLALLPFVVCAASGEAFRDPQAARKVASTQLW